MSVVDLADRLGRLRLKNPITAVMFLGGSRSPQSPLAGASR